MNDAGRYASVQRHILTVFVRLLFFVLPIPLFLIDFGYEMNKALPDWIPLGVSILCIGGLIGGVLDILLPQRFLIGGRFAMKAFNIGTLAWFEGINFKVKVNLDVDAGRKGIALKDHRE